MKARIIKHLEKMGYRAVVAIDSFDKLDRITECLSVTKDGEWLCRIYHSKGAWFPGYLNGEESHRANRQAVADCWRAIDAAKSLRRVA